jgi:hypothetical protein
MSTAQVIHTSTMISKCGTQEACLVAGSGVCVVLVFFMRGIIRFGRLSRVSSTNVVAVPLPSAPAGGEPAYDRLAAKARGARNSLVVKIYYTSGAT